MLRDRILDAQTSEDYLLENLSFEHENVVDLLAHKMEFKQISFINCRFVACDFSETTFRAVTFNNCDLANCRFINSYWQQCLISGCKADGGDFTKSRFKETQVEQSTFRYANCAYTLWEKSALVASDFRECSLAESKLKNTRLTQVDLTKAELFKTSLKGLDLSDCIIKGLIVSDHHSELQGAKLNLTQAVELAQLVLGIEVIC